MIENVYSCSMSSCKQPTVSDSFNQSALLPPHSSRSLVPKAAAGSEHCACLREANRVLNKASPNDEYFGVGIPSHFPAI